MLSSSNATYVFSGVSTTLAISGSTVAACGGCPSLTLTPSPVVLSGQTGGSAATQSVSVNTGGTPLAYALFTSGASWLSVSVPGGSTGGTFTVTATPGDVAPGSYNGSVLAYTAASNSPVTLPVTFNVTSPSFSLVASPSSMTFNSITGGTTPAQSLTVTTNPASSIPYTAAASSTGNWLTVTPTSGTTGGTPLSVSVNPAGLPGGTYTGTITLTASGATNSPLAVTVTLNVTTVTVAPTSLAFSFTSGGPQPSAQSLSLTSVPSVAYTASATSTGSWLAVTPTQRHHSRHFERHRDSRHNGRGYLQWKRQYHSRGRDYADRRAGDPDHRLGARHGADPGFAFVLFERRHGSRLAAPGCGQLGTFDSHLLYRGRYHGERRQLAYRHAGQRHHAGLGNGLHQ